MKDCMNINDIVEKIQEKFNTQSQITLYSSLKMKPIHPNLTIKEFLACDEFKKNSSQNPLIFKCHSIRGPGKTVFIR